MHTSIIETGDAWKGIIIKTVTTILWEMEVQDT